MSPGDATFALPYLYVNPHPAPEVAPEVATRLADWSTESRGFVAHSVDLAKRSDQQLITEIEDLILELA